jgi:hypothetical protein
MRRIITLIVVALVMAAMMVAIAMPVMAIENEPPRCEEGQRQAWRKAIDRGDQDQQDKHFDKARACSLGEPPGKGPQAKPA